MHMAHKILCTVLEQWKVLHTQVSIYWTTCGISAHYSFLALTVDSDEDAMWNMVFMSQGYIHSTRYRILWHTES